MLASLRNARDELKRVEHLVFVSLKYTRTVDIILNTLNRMVDAYSYIIEAILKKAEDEGELEEDIPSSKMEKINLVRELYPDDDQIQDNMDLYVLMRKLLNSKNIEREEEYRRNVTMKTTIDGREEIVNIDIVTNYFKFEKEFLDYISELFEVEEDLARESFPDWA